MKITKKDVFYAIPVVLLLLLLLVILLSNPIPFMLMVGGITFSVWIIYSIAYFAGRI